MKRYFVALFVATLCAQGAEVGKLVAIPASSRQVTDGRTGVPVTVRVDAFLIAPTELTQADFEAVMGYNPSQYRGAQRPVENVSWWDAIKYCNLRSVREGLRPCYDLATGECDLSADGYRLPTAAEWDTAAGPTPKLDVIRNFANLGSADTKNVAALLEAVKGRGTHEVAGYQPNAYGLYDMFGNVWEWCTDLFDPAASPRPASNPSGAVRGLERVLRGGSFISTVSSWARGYRTSMRPEYASRFTGFRVCRTAPAERAAPGDEKAWFEPYNRVPAGFENATGGLSPLLGDVTAALAWPARRNELLAKWSKLLGAPDLTPPRPAVRLVETVRDRNYTGRLMYLQVEPEFWEKIYIMMPHRAQARPSPVVIVPYYDVDVPAGRDLGGRTYLPASVRSFAWLAVEQGYIAVAIRWFGESYGEKYDEAVANLALKYPGCTGLGKWVWDAHRLLDYLYTLPEVDRAHVGIIGHSLGAKMALYAAALDERISAVVFSEGGIGLSFSNYDDYWYFGEALRKAEPGTDQHELLALVAPRPFLLIGGDQFDTNRSWYYVNAARAVYSLLGEPWNIGYFNHHTGHTPTPEAVWRSMEWLKHFLGPADR